MVFGAYVVLLVAVYIVFLPSNQVAATDRSAVKFVMDRGDVSSTSTTKLEPLPKSTRSVPHFFGKSRRIWKMM